MKHLAIPASALLVVSMAATAMAQSTTATGDLDFGAEIDLDRYSDAPWGDERVNLAVSMLTDEGVLRGNDDGTFAPDRHLNRAEFVQIVMRLLNDDGTVNHNCFPDVSPNVWYADPVCRAKAIGLVRGNAQAGVDPSLWRFEPVRYVQYEEAVKILMELYAQPIVGDTEGMDWYVPYLNAADDTGLTIGGLAAGDLITRGEMARLTMAFVANAHGQLDEYRDAEEGRTSSSSSRSSSSRSSTSSSRTSSSSSSSFAMDPDDDTTVRSNFLLLGESSVVLGAVNIFPNNEALDVDRITVDFVGDPASVESLRIYESSTGRFLGTASRVSTGRYVANVSGGSFIAPRRENTGIYVRANLRAATSGGSGGEFVQLDRITVEGTGVDSNSDYQVTSTDTFRTFQTSPVVLTSIRATDTQTTSAFTQGPNVILGTFQLQSESSDNRYTARVTSLTFRVSASAGVTLSDVELMVPGSSATTPCTVSGNVITCAGIPSSVGTVDDERTLRLMGDVSVDPGTVNPFIQVSLQEPGTPSAAGDITWTDGTNTYTWVNADTPVARGIYYH